MALKWGALEYHNSYTTSGSTPTTSLWLLYLVLDTTRPSGVHNCATRVGDLRPKGAEVSHHELHTRGFTQHHEVWDRAVRHSVVRTGTVAPILGAHELVHLGFLYFPRCG